MQVRDDCRDSVRSPLSLSLSFSFSLSHCVCVCVGGECNFDDIAVAANACVSACVLRSVSRWNSLKRLYDHCTS